MPKQRLPDLQQPAVKKTYALMQHMRALVFGNCRTVPPLTAVLHMN